MIVGALQKSLINDILMFHELMADMNGNVVKLNNFYYYNPTKIIFGKGSVSKIVNEISDKRRILIVYGGGSIKNNGVYEQVLAALAKFEVFELPGIQPNPEYETCRKIISSITDNNIDFILAVGGGSVIDATKFAALAYYSIDDPWNFMAGKSRLPAQALPFGCVLTLPGTGSEMNNGFVISNKSTLEKISCSSYATYPRFSVLDPEFTVSLGKEQTAFGIVDAFVHVLEQYMTSTNNVLQDRQAEAIFNAIAEIAPNLMASLHDYELRAAMMWCASQALNGTLSRGVPTDWATHEIGHAITAHFGLSHAQTLAIVLFGVWNHQFARKQLKLSQYGRRIWSLEGADHTVAERAIVATEQFFHHLGVPTRFIDYGLDADVVSGVISDYFKEKSINTLGENKDINFRDVKEILLARK